MATTETPPTAEHNLVGGTFTITFSRDQMLVIMNALEIYKYEAANLNRGWGTGEENTHKLFKGVCLGGKE